MILDVIEAYCSLGKPRNTVNSASFTDNQKHDSSKLLSDTLNLLQSKYYVLEYKLGMLSAQLKEEREARNNLQNIVRNFVVANTKDTKELDSIQWPQLESNI
ncbi:hypothetical protein GWI33_007133 [Rhynchophorus ferrugineus]|uniref:Uncharacterized protein n=1 Tax=Rhynchophorus ferrugineus TaxID=354439 RepID=A0A834ISB9_RHYFE|nr:hypothetical protein GWI33_007133 [Rhynchophorus ferrugineus]